MSQSPRRETVAVICDPASEDSAAVQAYLEREGISGAAWHRPRDIDDVDRAAREARITGVVFPKLSDFLEALWSERIVPQRWDSAGVSIRFGEFCETPQSFVRALTADWQRWRRRQRRRQAVAGAVLSVVALAAATALLVVL